MTALKEFARLESEGLWRADPQDQRREVILTFGDATLVITDSAGRALAHWSLPAIARINPGERPALFSPDPEGNETLEIADAVMIDAIEKVRKTILRARPRPGRLRNLGLAAVALALVALAVFWLPGALVRQAQSVVPSVKRAEIGAGLLGHIERLTGPSCRTPLGTDALARLHERVLGPEAGGQIVIVPDGPDRALYLPGGLIVMTRDLVEDTEDPAVVAGHVLAALGRGQAEDPLVAVLEHAGLGATVKLLTTGDLPSEALRGYAEALLTRRPAALDTDRLIAFFDAAQVPSTPYAYARDITGESTLALIEADPMAGREAPLLLSDGDWISIQGICT